MAEAPSEATGDGPGAIAVRGVQALLVVFAAFVAAAALIPLANQAARALGVAPDTPVYAVAGTIGQSLGFLAAAIVFCYYADDVDLLGLRRPTGHELGLAVGGAAVLLIAQYALLFGLAAVGVEVARNRALDPGQNAPVYYLYMVPVSLLFVGPAEETVFRGVAQGELRKALGAWPAIAIAAALFGSIHFLAGTGTLLQQGAYVFVAATLGIVLGVLYERTRTVIVPALAHGLYNATLFLIQYVGTTAIG